MTSPNKLKLQTVQFHYNACQYEDNTIQNNNINSFNKSYDLTPNYSLNDIFNISHITDNSYLSRTTIFLRSESCPIFLIPLPPSLVSYILPVTIESSLFIRPIYPTDWTLLDTKAKKVVLSGPLVSENKLTDWTNLEPKFAKLSVYHSWYK